MDNKIDISKLISSSVYRELNKKEQILLDAWLTKDANNKKLYDKICDDNYLQQKVEDKSKFDVVYSYMSMRESIVKRKKRRSIKIILRYAAAIVFPIFAGWFFIHVNTNKSKQLSFVQTSIIKAGDSKAQLILSNGEIIDISNLSTDSLVNQRGASIATNNNALKYTDKGKNDIVEQYYNTLVVPRGGEFKLELSDGTVVWLNSESTIKYPVNFIGKNRKVFLQGEAYFQVAHNAKKPFLVDIKGSEIKVLGTSFNVRAYASEKNIAATLVEGSVQIKSESNETSVLIPREQAVINSLGQISKNKVDVSLFTSWKDGRIKFKHQRLEDIINILYRWYDIEVFFMNSAIKDIEYSGNIKRYDDFGELVKLIEMAGKVKFEIKGKTVIIKEHKHN